MKCEICGKEILRDSQCINYKYYHNDCIENLQQENQQLKIQISAREEEYRKLDETNKVLSQELTKDNILKQEHLKTCCGISIGDIPKLITQQKEFIEYMNKTIEELECDDEDDEEMKGYLIQRIDTFKEILAKYIEINNRR